MATSDTRFATIPEAAYKVREADLNQRLLRRTGSGVNELFVRSVVKSEDWIIQAQSVKKLPMSLTDFISLSLRDEGNALIEETRQLNDRFAGCTISTARRLLLADLELLDLSERLLTWAEEVKNPLRQDSCPTCLI